MDIRKHRTSHPYKSLVWVLLLVMFFAGCRRIDPFVTPTARPPLPTVEAGITPTATRLQQYSNEVAFDMLYPVDWQNVIVRQGIIIFGTPGAVNLTSQSVEPSMLVYRQLPDERFSLEEEFARFMDVGPLDSGFELMGEQTGTDVDGREGIRVMVQRGEYEELDPARSVILAARADNGFNYYFVATAPEVEFDLWLPTFELMFSSVVINE